jgi:cyclopropane fatty-acyl-phospholipid synthase-like methyltransferase
MTTSAKSGDFFHGFADTFDTFYDGKRSPAMQWIDRRFRNDMFERYQLTFERLGDLHGKTIIDIGCGSGPYIIEAIKQGASHVLALDAAPRMLELTRQRVERIGAQDKVSYEESYFPPSSPIRPFNCAIVMGVLDYVEDSTAFLRALREIVTDAAVISFSSKHWFRTPIRKIRYRLRNCPVWFYSQAEIRKSASDAGWRTIDIRKIAGAGMDYHVYLKP